MQREACRQVGERHPCTHPGSLDIQGFLCGRRQQEPEDRRRAWGQRCCSQPRPRQTSAHVCVHVYTYIFSYGSIAEGIGRRWTQDVTLRFKARKHPAVRTHERPLLTPETQNKNMPTLSSTYLRSTNLCLHQACCQGHVERCTCPAGILGGHVHTGHH